MNDIFKEEWKRVKRGEPAYVVTKYTIVAAVLGAALYGAVSLVDPGHSRNTLSLMQSKI